MAACLRRHCNNLNKNARHHSFYRREISPLWGGRSRSSLVRGQDPFVTFDHLVPHCLVPEEAFSRHMRQVGESLGSLDLVLIPKYQVPQWLEADMLRQATRVNRGRQAGAVEAFPEGDSERRQATHGQVFLELGQSCAKPTVVLAH